MQTNDIRPTVKPLLGPIAEEIRLDGAGDNRPLAYFDVGSQYIIIAQHGPREWRVYNEQHQETRSVVPDDEVMSATFVLICDALRRMEYFTERNGLNIRLWNYDLGEPVKSPTDLPLPDLDELLKTSLGWLYYSMPLNVWSKDGADNGCSIDIGRSAVYVDLDDPDGWLVHIDGSCESDEYITVGRHDHAALRQAVVKLVCRELVNSQLSIGTRLPQVA